MLEFSCMKVRSNAMKSLSGWESKVDSMRRSTSVGTVLSSYLSPSVSVKLEPSRI